MFLSIITRHMPHRAALLAANVASLKAQTCQDYEQIIIEDDQRRGWQWAAQQLVTVELNGRYVHILDDDDLMINNTGIEQLYKATTSDPAAVIFKGWHGDGMGILPPDVLWGKPPRRGEIGSFDFVIRRDVYQEFIDKSVSGGYENDYTLIRLVYDKYRSDVVWLDSVICAVTQRGLGR